MYPYRRLTIPISNKTCFNLNMMKFFYSLIAVVFLSGCATSDPFLQNQKLGRGINLGNALDAPSEGEWGVTLQAEYFRLIEDAGFDSVRIPVRWSAHAATTVPYTIDPTFLGRVDWAVAQALSNNLMAVVNVHHYNELFADPAAQKERFLALWKQIAERYRDYPSAVLFEILNEPNTALQPELWNELTAEALKVIRAIDPRRTIVVDVAEWSHWRAVSKLRLPAAERNLIVSFHYYEPGEFTHQGASWVANSASWIGRKWSGSDPERQEIINAMDIVAGWAATNNRPVYMGEFGAFSKADMESRARWTSFVAREAEARGFSWAYWEFCSDFGAYDPKTHAWRQELLNALLP